MTPKNKWRTVCLAGLVAGGIGFIGTMYYPVEFFSFDLVQMLPLMVLNLCMYLGPIVAIIGGIGWTRHP
jgi:hypothetical protein